ARGGWSPSPRVLGSWRSAPQVLRGGPPSRRWGSRTANGTRPRWTSSRFPLARRRTGESWPVFGLAVSARLGIGVILINPDPREFADHLVHTLGPIRRLLADHPHHEVGKLGRDCPVVDRRRARRLPNVLVQQLGRRVRTEGLATTA